MAFGPHAADPTRPYLVYAFSWRGKPFYVGIGAKHSTRHTGRWTFVANLVRHESLGTLKPDKGRELARLSNSVLASLVRARLEPHEVTVLWEGLGRTAAEQEERLQIERHLAQGCVLANLQGVKGRRDLPQLLEYLGVSAGAER